MGRQRGANLGAVPPPYLGGGARCVGGLVGKSRTAYTAHTAAAVVIHSFSPFAIHTSFTVRVDTLGRGGAASGGEARQSFDFKSTRQAAGCVVGVRYCRDRCHGLHYPGEQRK